MTAEEAKATGNEGSIPWSRLGVVAGWALLGLAFAAECGAILRANHVWLVRQMPDDGFYYLEIGQRLAAGEGFTFDGINQTDGFHPLWQLIVGAFALVFSGDALVRVALIMNVVFAFGAVVLVMRLARPLVGSGAVLVGAIVAVHSVEFHTVHVGAMEGPLVAFCLAVLLTVFARADRRGWLAGDALLLGLATGGCVLARLDLAFVLPLVPVAVWWRSRSFNALLMWLGGALLGAGTWLVWHFVDYGHVATVSATVKQHALRDIIGVQYGGPFSPAYLAHTVGEFLWYGVWLLLAAVTPAIGSDSPAASVAATAVLAAAVMGLVSIKRSNTHRDELPERDRAEVASVKVALLLGLVLIAAKALFDVWLSFPYARAWYAAPQIIAIPFAIGALAWLGVRLVGRSNVALGTVLGSALVLAVLPGSLSELTKSSSTEPAAGFWLDELDRTADWVATEQPEGVYGAFDAGLIGFRLHSSRPVVNLDGRVNDFDHADLLLRNASDRELVDASSVDVLINRMTADRLAALDCGEILWQSEPVRVSATADADDVSAAPISVIDVRGCQRETG